MILCIDIGNTHLFGGVYADQQLQLQFRYPSATPSTSDQLGIFFKSVLNENGLDPRAIQKISICSVVPAINYSIRAAFLKYFSIEPLFIKADTFQELTVLYDNPLDAGADRISNAIAAITKFPNKALVIIDLGTATTFDIITANKQCHIGPIMPGVFISMKALHENTAKLSSVNIVKPSNLMGLTTTENVQSGLYYSHLGALKHIIQEISHVYFADTKPLIIGTGGFASFFEEENLFDAIIPELVLDGLYLAATRQIDSH